MYDHLLEQQLDLTRQIEEQLKQTKDQQIPQLQTMLVVIIIVLFKIIIGWLVQIYFKKKQSASKGASQIIQTEQMKNLSKSVNTLLTLKEQKMKKKNTGLEDDQIVDLHSQNKITFDK